MGSSKNSHCHRAVEQTENTEGSSKNGHCHRTVKQTEDTEGSSKHGEGSSKHGHCHRRSDTVTEQLNRQKRQKRKAQSTVTVVEQSNRQKTQERSSKHGHCHRTVEQTEDIHTEPPSAIIVTEQSNRQTGTHAQRQRIQSPEEKRWALRADLNDAMDAKYRLRAQGE